VRLAQRGARAQPRDARDPDGVAREGVAALDDASRGLAGSHARDAAAQLGGTAEEIARHAGRPVLLVAPPVGED